MFRKTRERLEEKYVEPVQRGITVAVVLAMLALIVSVIALGKVI